MTIGSIALLPFLVLSSQLGAALGLATVATSSLLCPRNNVRGYSNNLLFSSNVSDGTSNRNDNNGLLELRRFLQENYPSFFTILDMNEDVWKAIGDNDTDGDAEVGFTVFVPSDESIQSLGEKKQNQLLDARNLETTEKIAGYHVVNEPVSIDQLFDSGGVVTVSGLVPIERSVSGGFFGVGGKEDGGVTLNQAKVVRTIPVGLGFVHEVDSLISPSILWRFMDQLRIPGTQ